ncbi:unnamed protein product [Euphydryas editha]|uniref:Integrase catalytic domain-containing protein n=1 Tax=Euphydryas editha TaxID=104508 RepID=A0AAU9UVL4_EUPED|nr:unnamed protein product [Euphydryas editha]
MSQTPAVKKTTKSTDDIMADAGQSHLIQSSLINNIEKLNIHASNMPLTWKNFATNLKIYMRANNFEKESESRKVAILLACIGSEALEIFYSFNVDIDTISFVELLKKFEEYFLPKVNISMERHKLFNRKQGQDEDIASYATDIKNISLQCGFDELRDNILKDVFSWNLNSSNNYIREKLLTNDPKTFQESLDLSKKLETSRQQAKVLQGEQSTTSQSFVGKGRYRFLRLPFGINAASEIFHSEMVKRFSDLEGVKIMIDDILIYAPDKETHDKRLENVLKRAREINIKFNKEKSVICKEEVRYLGHVFSQKGVKVDESKVKAICDMPTPSNVNELQRFLGMVNYLGPFIDNLSKKTSCLRSLLSKNTKWSWSHEHNTEYNSLKEIITKTPVLTYYNPNKDITLSVYSSKDAMGAVICHNSQPIAYASASLTPCQQSYSQIEKELLAILFGCTKFHQYIYGRQTLVETDHKPIVSLMKKPLYDIPPRLQRIMLRLQPYDLKVSYKPGKYLYIADTLSRAALSEQSLKEVDQELDLHINMLISTLSVSPEKLKEIKENSIKDEVLSKIIIYCQNGWPEHKRCVSPSVKPYFDFKHQIYVIDNIVFKDTNYFSKYPEIALLNSSNSSSVITHLKSIFARHGIPHIAISDNGPPFNSNELSNFMREWQIKHITSSPYHSRSNGLVERSIRTIKNILKKCYSDKKDPYLAILQFRNTPKSCGYSPAQMCMSRRLRTRIPISDCNLKPKCIDYKKMKQHIDTYKQKTSLYYNQHTKSLPSLKKGEKVYFKKQPHNTYNAWIPGIISKVGPETRSYIISSPEGEFRRNREHIHSPKHPQSIQVPSKPSVNSHNLPLNSNPTLSSATSSQIKYSRFGRQIRKPDRFN